MKTVNASDFKARCLALLDEAAQGGDELVILKHGRPVARLLPPGPAGHTFPQEALSGSVRVLADLTEPAVPPEDWNAEADRS
jgi:prevent-host-death family protein